MLLEQIAILLNRDKGEFAGILRVVFGKDGTCNLRKDWRLQRREYWYDSYGSTTHLLIPQHLANSPFTAGVPQPSYKVAVWEETAALSSAQFKPLSKNVPSTLYNSE